MDFADQHAAPPSPMCDTRQCPVCTCTHDELDRTDAAYPYRHTEEVRAKVQAAHSEHLDDEDRGKDRHQTKVRSYATSYTTSYAMYPSLPPLRFNQLVLPLLLHAGASGFQLPCVLNPEHASFSSLQHPLLKSFWGTPSRSSTSRR